MNVVMHMPYLLRDKMSDLVTVNHREAFVPKQL